LGDPEYTLSLRKLSALPSDRVALHVVSMGVCGFCIAWILICVPGSPRANFVVRSGSTKDT
jgi:hypothetical protein